MIEKPDPLLIEILPEVKRIAIEAGEAIMHYYSQYRQDPEFVQYKQDNSPVTEADIVSNEIIKGGLEQLKVVYPIISEESYIPKWEERVDYNRVWLVDPLDGTREFVDHNDEFAIHIGLAEYGKPILGVVYAPAKELLFFAVRRMGAFRENKEGISRMQVRTLDMKDQGLHILHSRSHMSKKIEVYINTFDRPSTTAMGSSLKVMQIAQGKGDIYPGFSNGIKEWDTCAPQIILEESGGSFVCMEKGKPLEYNKEVLYQPDFLALGKLIAYYDY